MHQYFIYGSPSADTIEITDKDTIKHMFQVMRLRAGDEVVLVFPDGIKRRAEVVDAESRTMRIVEELDEMSSYQFKLLSHAVFLKAISLRP